LSTRQPGLKDLFGGVVLRLAVLIIIAFGFRVGAIAALAPVGSILARDRWRTVCLVCLLVASFVVVAINTHAHNSHRSYLDVYLAMLASYPVVVGGPRVLRHREASASLIESRILW